MSDTEKQTPVEQPRIVRPFEEQSLLEKYLRGELWNPARVLALAKEELPKAVRRKNWVSAGEWQAKIRRNEREVKKWTDLLDLYEAEFHAQPNADGVAAGSDWAATEPRQQS